jgi:UDP-3-O-[3-hydroxymyristoyl] glucosamine N-acyltransferase
VKPNTAQTQQSTSYLLSELAERFGCVLQGDGQRRVTHVAGLNDATGDAVSFVASPRYQRYLANTKAGAVIVEPSLAAQCPTAALVSKNPYAAFARIAALLHPPAPLEPGIHPTAVVEPGAKIDPSAAVGPHSVIGANVRIGPRVMVGPGSIVLRDASIESDTRLIARVTVCERVKIGARCIFHPGVVVGADGFGNANESGKWLKVPQVGSVRIGDDVEVGANTTIDRGAIDDTVIEDGVRLDNLIQIGHNVHVGAHTAMAACVGVAGSTTIGKHCMIGGAAGIAGQLEICDNVIVMGHSTVGGSITEPGTYSSALGLEKSGAFRRNAVRFRQLDEMAKQLQRLLRDSGREPPDED